MTFIVRRGGSGQPDQGTAYLGLSAEDDADLDAVIDDWLEQQIQ